MCGLKRERLSAARFPWVVERTYLGSFPISSATLPQAASIAAVESVRVPSCKHAAQLHELSSMNVKAYHIKQNSVRIEYLRGRWHCEWGGSSLKKKMRCGVIRVKLKNGTYRDNSSDSECFSFVHPANVLHWNVHFGIFPEKKIRSIPFAVGLPTEYSEITKPVFHGSPSQI